MLVEIIVGLVAILGSLYLFLTKHYDYWKKKGVVQIKTKFPLGIIHEQLLGILDAGPMYQKLYTQYKKEGLKYVGGFLVRDPTLVILDLDLCKSILTKDFSHFVSRDFTPPTHEFISKHLFALEGQEWKEMRTKLTPTFTSGKMKGMFTLMEKCVEQLQQHIEGVVLKKGQFEVKELILRFTTDIIATCAFGLDVNSIEDRENEFYKTGQLIFIPNFSRLPIFFLHKYFPVLSRAIRLNFYDPRVSTVLLDVMKASIDYRVQNNVTRNDFVDLLLKVKENRSLEDDDSSQNSTTKGRITGLFQKEEKKIHQKEDRLTLEEMTAQAFVFFAAGFETAASTTSFCLYELAKNPDVQETLRREIDEVLSNHGGHISYQALQEMTYMDQVMNETLRRYASIPFLTRVCTEPYQIPGTDLVIDKGVRAHIPTYAIHHDPDIYPVPYKFDPDRFSEENMKNRHQYAFLPFGEGPRVCIGMRFGKLQVKIGLAAILSKYQLSPAPDTPSKLEIDPFIVFTTSKQPFSLKISRRDDR